VRPHLEARGGEALAGGQCSHVSLVLHGDGATLCQLRLRQGCPRVRHNHREYENCVGDCARASADSQCPLPVTFPPQQHSAQHIHIELSLMRRLPSLAQAAAQLRAPTHASKQREQVNQAVALD
jgi:hypothetical protein